MNGREKAGLPLEQFIQAISSQLDRAQETMALKAQAGLPLTFALKDLTLELRTHVEMTDAEVRIRPAGPGETDTSVLHLALTTITRPMIEENTLVSTAAADEPTLAEVLPDVSEDERRRLEWAGIRTVNQLRTLQRKGGAEAIQRVSKLPVDRLRAALSRAIEPKVHEVAPEPRQTKAGADSPRERLVRIRGENFLAAGEGQTPVVRVDGRALPVLEATDRELFVRPSPGLRRGNLEVETGPGRIAALAFALDDDGDDGAIVADGAQEARS